MLLPPSSIRFAAASPAMASGSRCRSSSATFPSTGQRCRRARRSSIGRFRANGTSRRLYRERRRRARRRFPRLELARPELQHARFAPCCSLEELKEHIYTLPDQPDLMPYRTSYYEERWGFCMSQKRSTRCRPGTTRPSSIRRWPTAASPTASTSCPARTRTRCCFRRTSATPRSPTTIAPGWRC